jgi:integrase/recombinase XerD
VADEDVRDLLSIRMPRWGRVAPSDRVPPWVLLDEGGLPVGPVRTFLIDLVASSSSVRSYAYVLLRWWRWFLCTKSSVLYVGP